MKWVSQDVVLPAVFVRQTIHVQAVIPVNVRIGTGVKTGIVLWKKESQAVMSVKNPVQKGCWGK